MPISAAMPSTQPNTPAGIPNPDSRERRDQVEARLTLLGLRLIYERNSDAV